jgi:hypothetical protein
VTFAASPWWEDPAQLAELWRWLEERGMEPTDPPHFMEHPWPATWPLATEPWHHQLDAFDFAAERAPRCSRSAWAAASRPPRSRSLEHDRAAARPRAVPQERRRRVAPPVREHAARDWETGPATSPARAARCATRASRAAPSRSWTRSSTRTSPAAAVRRRQLRGRPQGDLRRVLETPRGTRRPRRVAPHQGARRRAVPVRRAPVRARPPRAAAACSRSPARRCRTARWTSTPSTARSTRRSSAPATPRSAPATAPEGQVRPRRRHPVYLTTPGGQPIYEGVRPDRLHELSARVDRIMFRVDQAELDQQLGLADPVDVYRTCELGGEARRVYDELERDGIAAVRDGVVTAANAMVTRAAPRAGRQRLRHRRRHRPRARARRRPARQGQAARRRPRGPAAHASRSSSSRASTTTSTQIRAIAEKQGRRYGELSGRRRDGLTEDSTMARTSTSSACSCSPAASASTSPARATASTTRSTSASATTCSRASGCTARPGRRVTYLHLLAESTVDRAIYGALRRPRGRHHGVPRPPQPEGKTP